jgi:two-component system cell cycle response regulator DivK
MRRTVVISSRDADIRELYVVALQSSRLQPYATCGVAEIIALAGTVRPDAVVVDVLDDDDWDICRALRADTRTVGIPIVALTGWVSVDGRYRERAAQCGCAAFVAKPAVPDTMRSTVERVIRGERGIEVMDSGG